jgi:hypothetical protein
MLPVNTKSQYNRTPLIRKLVIRVSNCLDLLDPSRQRFLTVIVQHFLWLKFFPKLSNAHKELSISVLFVRKKNVYPTISVCRHFSRFEMPM